MFARIFARWIPIVRNHHYLLLWGGLTASSLGDAVYNLALILYIYKLTGSAFQVGTLLMVTTLPALLLGLFAGVLVDRMPRRQVMIVADLVRAACALAMIYAHTPAAVYVLSFILNAVSKFFWPSMNSVLPLVIGRDHLQGANSLRSLSSMTVKLVGPALGGLLVGWLGFTSPFLFNAATFLFSATCILLLPASVEPPARAEKTVSVKELARDWMGGLRHIQAIRIVFLLLVIQVALGLSTGINNALVVVLAERVLKLSASNFGIMVSAMTGGVLAGSILAGYLPRDGRRLWFSNLALIISGLAFVMFAYTTNLTIALGLRVLIGIGFTLFQVTAMSILQEEVPQEVHGRVFSVYNALDESSVLLFMSIAGLAADLIGIQEMFAFGGSTVILAALAAQLLMRRTAAHHQSAQAG